MDHFDLAILGAVPREIEGLMYLTGEDPPNGSLTIHGHRFRQGSFGDCRLLVGAIGVGKVFATLTVTALFERFLIGEVWIVGCGGAYREGPLRPGDVLVTDRFLCGDEGVLTEQGILPPGEIGLGAPGQDGPLLRDEIPLVSPQLLARVRDRLPPGFFQYRPTAHVSLLFQESPQVSPQPLTRVHDRSTAGLDQHRPPVEDSPTSPERPLPISEGPPSEPVPAASDTPRVSSPSDRTADLFELSYGPSVTVGMASGDLATARKRYFRYRAFGENMEGSALAQVCLSYGVPMLEVRGMSNEAGVRNKDLWQLDRAMSHCHAVVTSWLREYSGLCTAPDARG